MRVEVLEDREVLSTVSIAPPGAFEGAPDGQVGQLQAFLNPDDPQQLFNVTFAMAPGLAGRVQIETYDKKVVYNGYPFGDDTRYGGTIAVLTGQPGQADRLAFGMPGAGAGPRVGVLAVVDVQQGDPPVVQLTQSFFALDPMYRGGIKLQSCPEGMNGPSDLLCLPGAGGGPVCTVLDPNTGVVKASVLAGPEDDRSGDYHFPSQGSGVFAPYVDGSEPWCFIVGRGYHAATDTTPPRFDEIRAFSLDPTSTRYPIGTDVTELFDVLKTS